MFALEVSVGYRHGLCLRAFVFLAGLLCVGCFCAGIKPNHNAEVLFIHECCMRKCYFISVRRINWVWLARKAHQPTRESKEVTKMK